VWSLASAALVAGCLSEPQYPDTFAGVIGATIAPDGAVLAAQPLDVRVQRGAADAGSETAQFVAEPSTPAGEPSTPAQVATVPASGGPCDLSGRWLLTEHTVVQGLGVRQSPRSWRYYEITQNGSDLTVTRGLHCGATTVPIDPLGESADLRGAWPALTARLRDDGREGNVRASGTGCAVKFDKRYEALGMSQSYADDPASKMPTLADESKDGKPGWEDWDQDGKPGVATTLTGLVSGRVHIAQRRWNSWDGTVNAMPSKFQLHISWNMEVSTFAIEGSDLLLSEGDRDPDESGHFVQFARLSDTQASAQDDQARCAEIRNLAPQLTPEANR
jgi:hypothetical protein